MTKLFASGALNQFTAAILMTRIDLLHLGQYSCPIPIIAPDRSSTDTMQSSVGRVSNVDNSRLFSSVHSLQFGFHTETTK